jgi:hypothetical protein
MSTKTVQKNKNKGTSQPTNEQLKKTKGTRK